MTQKGNDYVILDGVKGKGQYVGTYMALTAGALLVRRRGDKVLSGRRQGVSDDMRHGDRGLFRRGMELCD